MDFLLVFTIFAVYLSANTLETRRKCPYSAIDIESSLGQPALRNEKRWMEGFKKLHEYMFRRKDSSLDQLGILPPPAVGCTDCRIVPESEPVCNSSYPYRTHDGSCNNLAHPTWGMADDCQLRLMPAAYDGVYGFRKSVSGKPLPAPRDLSINVLPDVEHPSRVLSHMTVMFGQAVTHDMLLTPTPTRNLDRCCPYNERNRARKECAPILLKPDDLFYSQYNATCLPFERADECAHKSQTGDIQKVNIVTTALDLSLVYGSSEEQAHELRIKDGTGRLKFDVQNKVELLPRNVGNFSNFCGKNQSSECFLAGDDRVDQHATLTALQTVLLRDHNRLATRLKKLNPHWQEETLYQEARKIAIGKWQNMIYAEYLPFIVGPRHMTHFGLRVGQNGTRYNTSVRLGMFLEFSSAGFRLHSQVASKSGMKKLRFLETYANPGLIREGCADTLLKGACSVPSQEFDRFFVVDVGGLFIRPAYYPYGLDLASIDIWRGRDNGLPPYVDVVEYLTGGQTKMASFDDLKVLIPQQNIELLKDNYDSVSDVDLWLGLQLETHAPGSSTGFNSATLNALQFHHLKYADRFYFEHTGEKTSFTEAQLESIRNSSVSQLICDNTNIESIQINALLLPGPQNPIVKCDTIARLDLKPWKIDV